MSTYSGLNARDRARARRMIVQACHLMFNHKTDVHYTQEFLRRWEGIRRGLRAYRGDYPNYSDCSSSSTWILWQPYYHFGLPDKLNGTDWKSGYTGTLSQHGKRIYGTLQVGDLIFYGPSWPYEHVTVSLGGRLVFSHGSEAGPYLLDIDYRSDRKLIKRYL
jgi:hypothetical protein